MAGRPSKYEEQVKPKIKFIKSLVKDGFSQEDITEFLGISKDTFYTYKKTYKEFSDCFEKEDIIDQIEETYINRLLGKYRATREIYKREFNEAAQQYEMVLDKLEKYEIPFNDGAYSRYLAIMRPEKYKMTIEDNGLDTVVAALKNAVEKNKEENGSNN